MSDEMEMETAVAALQAAVDEEMERKAKLGYKAVVGDKNGRPKVVSAISCPQTKSFPCHRQSFRVICANGAFTAPSNDARYGECMLNDFQSRSC